MTGAAASDTAASVVMTACATRAVVPPSPRPYAAYPLAAASVTSTATARCSPAARRAHNRPAASGSTNVNDVKYPASQGGAQSYGVRPPATSCPMWTTVP